MQFISGFYDTDTSKIEAVHKRGQYGLDRCGGPCDWIISNKNQPDALFSVPYQGQCYFYLFTYYGLEDSDIEASKLHKLIQECKTATPVERGAVYLSDTQ